MSTNHHTSRLFAIALIALLLGAGAFGYWRSTQDRLPEGLSMGNGRLESTEVQIAAKIPGRLAEVRVDEGDKVLKGQLLARMDTRTLEAQRAQACRMGSWSFLSEHTLLTIFPGPPLAPGLQVL